MSKFEPAQVNFGTSPIYRMVKERSLHLSLSVSRTVSEVNRSLLLSLQSMARHLRESMGSSKIHLSLNRLKWVM